MTERTTTPPGGSPAIGAAPTSPGDTASPGTLPQAAPVPTDPASVAALLDRAARSDFTTYDPRAVVEAVNALVALGPEVAWQALDRWLAGADLAADPRHGLLLVLRTAFDAEAHPPVRLGTPDQAPPTDPGAAPRFPLVIVDDVPVLLVARYAVAGVVEPISIHVEHYRAHGTLRGKPLAPGSAVADRVEGVVAVYRAAYRLDPPAAVRAFVEDQLRRGGY